MNSEEQEKQEEQDGIRAIIYLQSMAGIVETEETARKGWRKMSVHDRQSTMIAYLMFKVPDDSD